MENIQQAYFILRSMTHPLIATDKNGLITVINPAASDLIKIKEVNATSKPLKKIVKIFDSKSHSPVKIISPASFKRNKAHRKFINSVLLTNSGTEIAIDAVLAPLKGNTDNIEGSLLIMHNISKTDKSELNRQKIKIIGDIADSIANGFNNWLSIISNHASSITDNLIPNTKAHDEALLILDAVKQAGIITKRLLSFARVSNHTYNMKIEDVYLGKIIRDATMILERRMSEREISIKINNPNKMPYVKANTFHLTDVLIHLLINSIDAMPSGGTITIDAHEKNKINESFIVLRIRDTGNGISSEIIKQIFDPFFSTKKSETTIGLGLTIVQSSLKKMGGFIKVRSLQERGTSFRIFLPKARMHPQKQHKLLQHSGGEIVLLADDNKIDLDEIKNMLQTVGYQVYTATNGTQCSKLYEKYADKINISIIDVIMPGKDGKRVLEDILKFDPTASIIMTSGFSREYIRKYLKRGAWEFIQKPINHSLLLNTMHRMLENEVFQ